MDLARRGAAGLAPFVPLRQEMIRDRRVSTRLVSLSVVVFIGHGAFNSCLVHDEHEVFDFFWVHGTAECLRKVLARRGCQSQVSET